jgi:hypothetical protein
MISEVASTAIPSKPLDHRHRAHPFAATRANAPGEMLSVLRSPFLGVIP